MTLSANQIISVIITQRSNHLREARHWTSQDSSDPIHRRLAYAEWDLARTHNNTLHLIDSPDAWGKDYIDRLRTQLFSYKGASSHHVS
jgi:hypothetical protein|tara:strand:+ start:669 stop:932 length:264 start_codon:yes stop_codon:yes gene_type:complete